MVMGRVLGFADLETRIVVDEGIVPSTRMKEIVRRVSKGDR